MYDDLIGELYSVASNVQSKNRRELLERAASAIEDLKTTAANVRPVVRGKWQPWKQDRPPLKWYSCDYCGFHALNKSNFCPNCGADMRGEADEK